MNAFAPLGAALALALLPAEAGAQQTYTLVDLAVGSPYDAVTLNSINSAGHVSGFGVIGATGEIHAFIWQQGVFADLGLLGYAASDGIAINNADQLAADGIGPGSTALFYANGTARPVGSVDGGTSSAAGINNHGDIVGSARNGDGNLVGFSWIGGAFTDLSTIGMLKAAGINDSDQIVGSSAYYWGAGGYLHGVYHAGLLSGGTLTDLGSLSGDPRTNNEALAINAAGQVVGYSTAADGLYHGFLWSGGPMQDLGTVPGENASAVAINSSGIVIGNLANAYNVGLGAFIWANGAMTDLGSLVVNGGTGWTNLAVTGLNDAGSIVGAGTVNGGTRGFLLVPTSTTGVGPGLAALRTAIPAASPNPFESATTITLALSERGASGPVRLEVFDTSGRRVARLLDERLSPGMHAIAWDGRAESGNRAASGVYFARLSARDATLSRRIVLAK